MEPADSDHQVRALVTRAALAVLRAALTSVTVLAILWLILRSDVLDGGGWALLVALAISAVIVPAVALACAAPGFRISEYLLNGGYAVVIVPALTYARYDSGGRTHDPAPQWLWATVFVSAPALLGLVVTTLIWIAFRRFRHRRAATLRGGPRPIA